MSEPTLRQLARGIKARHVPVDRFDVYDQPLPEPWCRGCTRPWPCPDRIAAESQLDLIEGAQRIGQTYYDGPIPADWIEIYDPNLAALGVVAPPPEHP